MSSTRASETNSGDRRSAGSGRHGRISTGRVRVRTIENGAGVSPKPAGSGYSRYPAGSGYSRYVVRVGALSVALGVGAAIASMPAVAFADETGSGGSTGSSSSGSSGSSSGASSEGAGASPSTSSESSPSGGSSAGSDSDVSSEVDTSDIDVSDVDASEVDVSDVDTPTFDVSDVDTPTFDASDVDAPEVDVSDVDTPTIDASDIDASDVDTPTIDASDIDASDVDASDVDTPTTGTSGVSGSGGASDWVSGPGLTAPRGVWRGVAHADPAQENVANFNELSRQAEQLLETMQAAQLDLDTKLQLQSEADQKHADDLAALDAAKAQLAPRQAAVDKLAAADYMGAGAEGFSAILTAASPQRFIDKLTIQRVMATTMSEQLQSAHQVEQEAQTIEAASAKSAADAKAAADAASVVRADLQKKQSQLQTQVAVVKASYAALTPAMQAVLGPGAAIPTVGMRGLVPNARALAAYIIATYPGVQSIGGVRADWLPDHPSGRALDIMTGSDMSLGDAINADVQSQTGRFGVAYTMWRVANHFDHIHVTVS